MHKIYLAIGDNQVQCFWQVEDIGYEIRVIPLVSETNEIEVLRGVKIDITASKIS